jgi:hypothetical protein
MIEGRVFVYRARGSGSPVLRVFFERPGNKEHQEILGQIKPCHARSSFGYECVLLTTDGTRSLYGYKEVETPREID